MYRLICRRMLRDLEGGLGGGFVFVLREIIHRLVYLLQEMREQEGYLFIFIYQFYCKIYMSGKKNVIIVMSFLFAF